MSKETVSVDEFLNARKGFVKSGDILMKAAKAPASWNPEARTARFVMSSEVEDRDKDIIRQAGLHIDEFMRNPVAPFSHNSGSFPVGTWSDVEKLLNGRPKRTEGVLNLVPEGDEVADRLAFHIAAGSIRACSIGFIPKTVQRRERAEDANTYSWPGYEILEAELVECSPCVIPANPAALAKSAAEGDVRAREIIEDVLDNWVKHPETGLLMPRAEFEAAHRAATNEKTTFSIMIKGDSREALQALRGVVEKADASMAVPETVPPQKPAAEPDISKPEVRSLIRRALDMVFGGENEARVDAKLREAETAPVDQAARRAALQKREKDLEARLQAKSLV